MLPTSSPLLLRCHISSKTNLPSVSLLLLFLFTKHIFIRRQTAEEREAERQAANRILMTLQSDPPKATNGHMYPSLHNASLDSTGPQVKPEDAALAAAASMSGLNLPYSALGSIHSLPPHHPWSSAHQAHQALVASHLSGLIGRPPPGSTGLHHESLNPYSLPSHLTSSSVLC